MTASADRRAEQVRRAHRRQAALLAIGRATVAYMRAPEPTAGAWLAIRRMFLKYEEEGRRLVFCSQVMTSSDGEGGGA